MSTMKSKSTAKKLVAKLSVAAVGIAAALTASAATQLPGPITDDDYRTHDPARVQLGKFLFFDKILSGNQNISCATCHHPLAGTGDGLSLPVGEGGEGLGVARNVGSGDDLIVERVPRNAPPIFNLGAKEFTVMFHDGRLFAEPSKPTGFFTPAAGEFPLGVESPVAAQAMFPVTSGAEMAGQPGENDVGSQTNFRGKWAVLATRLRAIPEYVELFKSVYSDVNEAQDITYVHAANAIGAFEDTAWRADNSPFDKFLRGDDSALSDSEKRGMDLFYGDAGCSSCHRGKFMTDHFFHAIAMPQIGPGKGDETDGHGDFGREQATGNPADRYKFRTPNLRNVALTGPWGHDGAYNSLEAVVRHHLDPVMELEYYNPHNAVLPEHPTLGEEDLAAHDNPFRRALIAAANELEPVDLSDEEVHDLLMFLKALTDPASLDMRGDVPSSVPSGLPIAD